MSSLLLCGLALSNPFSANIPPSKHNNFPPKLKFRASTATNLAYKEITTPTTEVNQQPHLILTPITTTSCNNFIVEPPNEILHLLNNITHVSDVKMIHARVMKLGLVECNGFIGNKLVVLYSKDPTLLDDARCLLGEVCEKGVLTYAALIGSYRRNERWGDVISVAGLMVHQGFQPDKFLLPTVLKACAVLKVLRVGRIVHGFVVRRKLELDVFVGNALIDMYSNCGDLGSSRVVFDTIPKRDVVSWTSLISAYMNVGLLDEVRNVYELMQLSGMKLDVISWNSLVSGFARNGEIDEAVQLLEEMGEKGIKPGVSSWNGIISGCVQNGYFEDALDVYGKMLWSSVDPNAVTNVSVISACAGLLDLNLGRAIHACVIKCEIAGNIFVGGSLISLYSKCGRTDFAEKVFAEIKKKNTAVWNEMIGAYVNEEKMSKAKGFFKLMKNDGPQPDLITYNTMLGGYAREEQKEEAYLLLLEMSQIDLKPNLVSLNVLISGFQQSGLSEEALKLFRLMQSQPNTIFPNGLKSHTNFPSKVLNAPVKPNPVTTASALAACADLHFCRQGREIHAYVVRSGFESNIYVSSALVDMYAKCHDIYSSTKIFYRIDDKNTVAWNILMAGLVKNKKAEEALKLFPKMLGDALAPSLTTLVILLSACSYISALRLGRELHGYIMKSGFNVFTITLGTSLVDMYAKCGNIIEARRVFESVVEKDIALYNAMISGYSFHGSACDAFALFEELERLSIKPDHITFTALLSACTREGLVEEGWQYFNSLENTHGIKPSLEHFTCMVGIMGRAGLLEEALDFMGRTPYVPDACMWSTLLKACRHHSNPEIGERAAKALFDLEPNNVSNYITLSNIYTVAGMWDSAKSVRSIMKDRGLMAISECSFIDVNNTLYAFKGGENSHPELEDILGTWDKFATKMEHAGFRPLNPVFDDERELDLFSCLHTEKLAVCFGIITSNAHRPIRISKNLRMCIDCHTSVKYISKIDEREVFVKDGSFYHHFKNGICSCDDRW
ncbi:hypothetical protein GIB67_017867 [Kingdonia uniflora]|uniref:DYW domain-containing protein n=1 Tax=Kingdonia uniflora TaxID=39325 RepID=A0A7J7ML16_9MAGN|nr:hypothetical protein GIB67_017867 [Kingdonia uniflora]